MSARICYATTDEGLELPIVDVTDATFAVRTSDAELDAMADQYVREARARQDVPAPLLEALRNRMGRPLLSLMESGLPAW